MSLTVSLAVLLAALLHAGWNAMVKGGGDALHDTAGIIVGAMAIGLPFLFVVPLPAAAAWPFIVASVTVHLAYYWLMISAYRVGDLSLVYPLMRGVAPLITAVAGIAVLGETPPAVAWLGMLLVSGGVFLLPGATSSGCSCSTASRSRCGCWRRGGPVSSPTCVAAACGRWPAARCRPPPTRSRCGR
ncbi:MAG: hypothetical protein MUF32_06385 [Burkholderiaceae bacterium]|nr:hypothetical protein [Burkholderiaceae bacterium]